MSSGEMRVGMAVAAPWLVQDPNTNKYLGPAETLVEAIAARLKVKVAYVAVGWDNFPAALQANQVDLVAAPLSVTPERQKVVSMVPWSSDGSCYFVKKSSSLSTLADLGATGLKFGVGQGSLGETNVKADFPQGKVVARQFAPGEQFLYPELHSGAIDVSPIEAVQSSVYLAKPGCTVVVD
jgi:ABC-type amino acid transport substrate-binding protein